MTQHIELKEAGSSPTGLSGFTGKYLSNKENWTEGQKLLTAIKYSLSSKEEVIDERGCQNTTNKRQIVSAARERDFTRKKYRNLE